ncbi:hypothetical protein [Novosphingobium capsulatum]|uniref:hypothetical protein n=1 Tax=Novosphingobium capsulatum TaxID=13688 RepID=UPI000788F87A|nr:hypothetical protein [Novosphingobium capsulatum]WQD93133.1 hypothetical protein U0041_00580 [Novosphingobium capsulatum]
MKALVPLALLIAAPAMAQSSGPPPQVDAAMSLLDQGHYLTARDKLAKLAFDPQGRVKDEYAYQMWQQESVMVTGELDLATLDRAHSAPLIQRDWIARVQQAVAHDALAEIARRAKDTRIVILNEAHSSPRDRMFALQVARALRPLGYGVLAAEAFYNDPAGKIMARLRHDGFVRRGTGFYTLDPVYARFVRTALAMGYTPAAYEQTEEQSAAAHPADRQANIVAREQAQAENLAALMARFPSQKVLIYVGHSHVAEAAIDETGEGNPKIDWMAARLKRMTGIDPLTIDQATVTDLDAGARPAQVAAARLLGRRPGILFEQGKPLVLGQYAGAVDLQVIHPARRYRFGRPAWLAASGARPVPVPAAFRPRHGRCLVQAFPAGASADAVPLDQVMITAGERAPALLLPARPMRFFRQCVQLGGK